MKALIVLLLSVVICAISKPMEGNKFETTFEMIPEHRLSKRFINPSMTSGAFVRNEFSKIRAKRDSEDECEKLRLCKLHAESSRSFIAAFELYFVNKENARLWDHHSHSMADCDQRYSCYT